MNERNLYSFLEKTIQNNTFYDELYYEPLNFFSKKAKINHNDIKNLHIGLINIPCEGFGDIVNCGLFYQTLKLWYPKIKITICTSEYYKFQSLKFTGLNFIELIKKEGIQECGNYGDYRLKKTKSGKNPKFDIIGVVPLILSDGMHGHFVLSHLQKLIPYAEHYNTFNVSEYNGQSPPYTFPIGVGEGQLGMLFMNMEIPKQKIIEKPFALAYIQHTSSKTWGPHSVTCILSYLEMTCKKYNHHKKFQIIVPKWFCSIDDEIGIFNSYTFKRKVKLIIQKYFKSCHLLYKNEHGKTEKYDLITKDKNEKCKLNNILILRGDILPQPRKIFISLIKDSVDDVLLTGDQSITDALSNCKKTKRIWYQTAPWKLDFSYELNKIIPNKYLGDFHSTCGTIKSLNYNLNNKKLIEKYDFRKLGKPVMDSVILQYINIHNDNFPLLKYYYHCLDKSKYKETALQKFQKYKISEI